MPFGTYASGFPDDLAFDHKHTDLADDVRRRVEALGPIPSAYTNLEQQARDAQEANEELRAQNRQLRARVTAYARLIH